MTQQRRWKWLVPSVGIALLATSVPLSAQAGTTYTTTTHTDGRTSFVRVQNPNGGATLSYAGDTELITLADGDATLAFKDSNGNGELDPWEDWREDYETRAQALAQSVSIDQIAGLMLFSSHQRDQAAGLTDAQRAFLSNDELRNVLNAGPNDVEDNVTWNNEVQAFVEGLATGDEPYIPVNFSSDPRSTAGRAQYDSSGDISRWPSHLGLAAIHDTDVIHDFARIASEEYRALGIATALGPQIDTSTDPRWLRVDGTFGEDFDQSADAAAAYVHASQNSFDEDGNPLGWGRDSINTMIKHVPGDAAGEGGREAHTGAGRYNVFPGDGFDGHLAPFIAGLDSMSMMSKYSISIDADGEPMFGNRVGSAYNKELIDIVRAEYGYDGVICTDWGVTSFIAHGMDGASVDQRHFLILVAGLDMFGGNNNKAPVLAAYDLWQAAYEAGDLDISADERFRKSAERILRMFFAPGIYDDPYLDLAESQAIVASPDKVAAGYQAQLNSVVMLKNADGTIQERELAYWADKTVYIPSSMNSGFPSLFGGISGATSGPTMDVATAERYFGTVLTDEPVLDDDGNVIDFTMPDLTDVDLVVAGMRSPMNGTNFSSAGLAPDGTFYPLSLQYRPYTADGPNVRRVSIAGDILPDGSQQNRSYYGETSRIANERDLDAVLDAVAAVDDSIPVIVALKAVNPTIPAEFEPAIDALVVGFSVSDGALFDVILGQHDPQGRLPIAFPRDMDAVEAQLEDLPHDMDAYVDTEGNEYEYGFGLSWEDSDPTDPPVTPKPTPNPVDVYTTPGFHNVNGRWWQTECEPYSQTVRCRTEIWATIVWYKGGGQFVRDTGWHFNNLTYLPFMTRQQWSANPLGYTGEFTSDGRKWMTECDTERSGRDGCRSYLWVHNVVESQPRAEGGYTYTLVDKWVFNNIVKFRAR
ncbi:glycoside hydrolase family 3 N-terminal domain-containing protein [Tessaracoccus flavus]|uniref:beta-glucosidase n=1 Tax=Tessaracoccus flavus TaxID=1610493 RepID=A0A1Q2CCQ6_9ACTN|nr:glycoside hydrolase family 3 N-terminal domain-containing protein [Tessaracoccus flavus]AQP43899.1 hypothetical protein RPIT_02945 [Tessaracoccus flavus]SDY27925.1 beta-glucosidase [Tessaracoccus flavus]